MASFGTEWKGIQDQQHKVAVILNTDYAKIDPALYDWMSVEGILLESLAALLPISLHGEVGQSGEEGSRHTLPPMRNPPARGQCLTT
jgi:hypothetical protein